MVAVYDRKLNGTPKREQPNRGFHLNNPCVVTLERITNKSEKYYDKLKASTEKAGAKFISYDSVSEEWVFEVSHFGK